MIIETKDETIAKLQKERELDGLYIDRLERFKRSVVEIEKHYSQFMFHDDITAKLRDSLEKNGLR